MKKIFVSLILSLVLISHYSYATGSCYLCSVGIDKDIELVKPSPEKVEALFNKIGLSDNIEYINPSQSYTLKYLHVEFTYVYVKDGNKYLFVEKKGSIIAAVNHYQGEESFILPQSIQLEGLCELNCFLAFGGSIISLIACPMVPIAKILYPSDQELHEALSRTCSNGIFGLSKVLACSLGFCY